MFETKRTQREQGNKNAIEITLTDARENLSADESALSLMLIA